MTTVTIRDAEGLEVAVPINSDPPTSAKQDLTNAALGTTTDAAAGNTGGGSIIAFLRKLRDVLPTSIGQKTGANSLPVVVASDQTVTVGPGDPSTTTVTISSGGSLSGAVDLANQRLHRLAMPSGWTTAAITFQVSPDGVTYNDLYNETGEYTLPSAVVSASRSIVVDPAMFYGVRYVKVRSGPSSAGVNQAADRVITLVTVAR